MGSRPAPGKRDGVADVDYGDRQGLLARTVLALDEIQRRHPEGMLVVVGHDSVNRVLLLHALDLPLSRYWHLRQDTCGIDSSSFAGAAFVIAPLDETQHLSGLG
jgi:probable phosphoglycerate mutase